MKAAIVYSGFSAGSGNIFTDTISADTISADNRDTLLQLEEISAVLTSLNIAVESIPLTDSISTVEQALCDSKADFVFNLVETIKGSDALIYIAAALYEFLEIPYSGCSAQTLVVLGEKIRQKELLKLAGLATADYIFKTEIQVETQSETESEREAQTEAEMNARWIVKSNTEHASVGLTADSVVDSVNAAQKKIELMKSERGGNWFAEKYIDGREFNISMLENEDGEPVVLPAAEIVFKNFSSDQPKIVDYAAKWDETSEVYLSTQRCFDFPESDQPLLCQLEALCHRCWHLFHLRGAARVDFRIDKQGNPWILEINANPCLSSDAGLMVAAARAGLSAESVIKRLIPRQCFSNYSFTRD